MTIESFKELSADIKSRAEAINFSLNGPEEIQYGFGWEPTITFWNENRRVHFYFGVSNQEELNVEVAEIQPELKIIRGNIETNSLVKKTVIKTNDEAWAIVDAFLCQRCNFEGLPIFVWTEDTNDVDKFIPHPPNINNPGNIISLVDELKRRGEVWHPEQSKRQSWWKKWFER